MGAVDSEARLQRYSRQIIVPEIGVAGQERLAKARVLCVGAGGLGSASLPYLVAAGVGRVGVVEFDTVDVTNCHRQVLYAETDVGKKKVRAACERLHGINSTVALDPIPLRLDSSNARELVRLYDVVVDGTDNIWTRYLLNDACFLENRPLVYAAIAQFEGQVAVFARGRGACYRCLFPNLTQTPPNCAETGVLGVLPGIIGTLQANEALKILLGIGEPLYGSLFTYNALSNQSATFTIPRDEQCALCGEAPSIVEVEPSPAESCAAESTSVPAARLREYLEEHPEVQLLDLGEIEQPLDGIASRVHMPARQILERLHELSHEVTYLVACPIGIQSLWAIGKLRQAGFNRLLHLEGGLNRFMYSAMPELNLGQ